MPASLSGPRLALLLALSATLLALAACGDDAQPRSGDQGDNNSANNAANNGANNGGDNNDQENNGGDNNDAPLVGLRLSVGDAQARSCEVVILDPDERVESVSFGQGAQGQSMRRGARLALAFIADGDAALGEVSLSARDGAALSLLVPRCFDAQGQALADPGLALLQ